VILSISDASCQKRPTPQQFHDFILPEIHKELDAQACELSKKGSSLIIDLLSHMIL